MPRRIVRRLRRNGPVRECRPTLHDHASIAASHPPVEARRPKNSASVFGRISFKFFLRGRLFKQLFGLLRLLLRRFLVAGMLTRCFLGILALTPIALILLLFLVSHGSPSLALRRATSVPN